MIDYLAIGVPHHLQKFAPGVILLLQYEHVLEFVGVVTPDSPLCLPSTFFPQLGQY